MKNKKNAISIPALIWEDDLIYLEGEDHYLCYDSKGLFTGVAECGDGIIYLKNGVYHRDDGPGYIADDGDIEWYKDNQCHRIEGPARVIDGTEEYWFEGRYYDFKEWLALVWDELTPEKKKEYIYNGFLPGSKMEV